MFRAELLKLTTTTATKVAVIVGVVGLLLTQLTLVTLLPALASGAIGPGEAALGEEIPTFALDTVAAQLAAFNPLGSSAGSGSIGIALLAILVLGVLAGTTDYRYGGIVTTALAQPRRTRLVMAKVSATALVALFVGLVFAAVSFVSVLVSLPIAGAELVASPLEIVGVLGRGVVVVTLLTLIGLAIGVLARSQLLGVIIVIGVLLLELIVQAVVQLITGTLPLWAQVLPFALGQAATSTGVAGGIAPLAAIAGLTAFVGVILVIVGVVVRRRDI